MFTSAYRTAPSYAPKAEDPLSELQNCVRNIVGSLQAAVDNLPENAPACTVDGLPHQGRHADGHLLIVPPENLTAEANELANRMRVIEQAFNDLLGKLEGGKDDGVSTKEIRELEIENRAAGERIREATRLGEIVFSSLQDQINAICVQEMDAVLTESEDEFCLYLVST